MSKNILIALLGNRDLQLRESARISLNHKDWFEQNHGGKGWIINKFLNTEQTFFFISEHIDKEYELYKDDIYFPMIQSVIDSQIEQPDKIIFCTSGQKPPHAQDCPHVANIAVKHFTEKKHTCEAQLFECPPTDFVKLINFFTDIFETLTPNTKVYVTTGSGTPQMKTAAHFSGFFRGYEYYYVNEGEEIDELKSTAFNKQEAIVLRSMITSMLDAYDYEGITNLPVEDNIKALCREALDLYNFNTAITNGTTHAYDTEAKKGLAMLYENLKLCYIQGRYADVVGRIFRIEEAMGHLLFFQILQEENILDANEEVELENHRGDKYMVDYRRILVDKTSNARLLQKHFAPLYQGRSPRYVQFPNVPMMPGKNFWYFFCRSLNKYPTVTTFFEQLNNNYDRNNPLVELRNKSILGHGYEGVSKQEIDNLTGGFGNFLEDLKQLFINELNIPISEEFEQINEKILAIIDQ